LVSIGSRKWSEYKHSSLQEIVRTLLTADMWNPTVSHPIPNSREWLSMRIRLMVVSVGVALLTMSLGTGAAYADDSGSQTHPDTIVTDGREYGPVVARPDAEPGVAPPGLADTAPFLDSQGRVIPTDVAQSSATGPG
jgi:hypothetical protein